MADEFICNFLDTDGNFLGSCGVGKVANFTGGFSLDPEAVAPYDEGVPAHWYKVGYYDSHCNWGHLLRILEFVRTEDNTVVAAFPVELGTFFFTSGNVSVRFTVRIPDEVMYAE